MGDATIRVTDTLKGTRYHAVVEDDLRVAYAYLYDGERAVGQVWLYNRGPAPRDMNEPTWREGPYRNAAPWASNNDCPPISGAADVQFIWRIVRGVSVLIRIHGVDWAVLRFGAIPGWCRLARRANPLALPLSELPPDAEVPEIRDGR